jgi:hypothetical protein
MDPTPQTPSPDPYAAYGGRATDPYAAYGGKLADAGGSPPPVSVSNPAPAVASPPRPQPAQDAITDGLTANPKGEGTYEVKGPRGIIRVPYSSVRAAAKQGYTFTNNQDLTTYAKDYEADPINEGAVDHYLNTAPWWDVPSHIVNQLRGMGAGVESTVAGAEKIGKRMSGHGDEPLRPAEQALQVEAAKPGHNPVEDQGNLEENIGEFFSGDELLGLLGKSAEALPAIDKLKQAQQVASTLSQNPLIAKLLRIGVSAVKNGAIAGGQTYAKTGGDTGAAVAAGATTAIGGAALEGAGEYVGGKIASHAATNENIAGVDVNVPAETARPKESPQQKAGKQVIKNAAQGTAQGHLEEVNESRAVPENGNVLPARTGPFEFKLRVPGREETTGDMATRAAEVPKTESHAAASGATPQSQELGSTARTVPSRLLERETPGFKTSSAEGENPSQTDYVHQGNFTTQDPLIARAHAANLNRTIGSSNFRNMAPETQKDLLAARDEVTQQLQDYHKNVLTQLPGYNKPNFQQIDVGEAVKKIGSYSDAAAAVKGTATDGYKAITDALAFTGESPQHLQMIRTAYQEAENEYMGANNPAQLASAEGKIEAAHEQLRQMLARVPNAASLKEFSGMNDAYRNGLGLEKISRAIDGSFHGPMSSAKRAFEYSGFNGQQLGKNMEGLIRTMGRPTVERLMGRENLDSVLQIAQATSTNAGRAKIGIALKAVTNSLIHLHAGPIAVGGFLVHVAGAPWEVGAGAGLVTSEAFKRVTNAVMTNPAVAKNLLYAVEYGANPEHYGPFIATLIQRAATESSSQQPEEKRQ